MQRYIQAPFCLCLNIFWGEYWFKQQICPKKYQKCYLYGDLWHFTAFKWDQLSALRCKTFVCISWALIPIFWHILSYCYTSCVAKTDKNGQKLDFNGILRHKVVFNGGALNSIFAHMCPSARSILFDFRHYVWARLTRQNEPKIPFLRFFTAFYGIFS